MYAPVALFCYKRLDSLKAVVDALKKNNLAQKTKLYIYSDAPKYSKDEELVNNVRSYIGSISGFEEVSIEYATFNKGLAKSIIDGVSSLLSKYNKIIVLEDDLSVSNNFLQFMNNALEFYEYEERVFSITGFSTGMKADSDIDVFFTKRSSSWGWATWKDRWEKIDWNVSDYQEFKYDFISRFKFNRMGSDMSTMLDKQINGKINSWAIRWCYHQFKYDLFSVHPFVSKVENIGFNDIHATHTKEKVNRFSTNLDCSNKLTFKFDSKIELDNHIIKQFVRPYSLKQRIIFKMINFLNK